MKYCENGTHIERTARKAFDFLASSHDPQDLFKLGRKRLNMCQAWIYQATNGKVYLKSYDTIVAVIINTAHGNICVANGTYSPTTVQHIYKFAKKYGAPVEYLRPLLKAV